MKSTLVVALLLVFTFSGAGLTGSDFDWQQPLDVESRTFPKDICTSDGGSSGEDYFFQVNLSSVNNDGTLYLERKQASSKTWSDQGNVEVGSSWSTQSYYFQDASSDFLVNESGSNTVNIDNTEHTFDLGTIDDAADTFQNLKVDAVGDSASEIGDLLSNTPENRRYKVTEVSDNNWADNTEAIEITIYEKVTIPEGNYDYRYRFEPSGNDNHVSEPAYITCDSERTPVPDGVDSNATVVNPFSPYEGASGVTPASNVNLNLSQKDNDDYNVTLYDSNDNFIAKIERNGDELKYFDAVADSLYFWQESGHRLSFVNDDTDTFMDNAANTYKFYFKIVDDKAFTRYSAQYEISTSGSNDVPNITSFEGYNGSWNSIEDIAFGEDQVEKVRAKVEDSNNDRHNAYLNLSNNFDDFYKVKEGYYSSQSSGTTYTWNLSSLDTPNVLDSGNWSANVRVSDGAASDTEYRTWSYPFSEPNVTASNSSSTVKKNNEVTVNVSVSCSQYECINENESIKTYLDPEKKRKILQNQKSSRFKYWKSWLGKVMASWI